MAVGILFATGAISVYLRSSAAKFCPFRSPPPPLFHLRSYSAAHSDAKPSRGGPVPHRDLDLPARAHVGQEVSVGDVVKGPPERADVEVLHLHRRGRRHQLGGQIGDQATEPIDVNDLSHPRTPL